MKAKAALPDKVFEVFAALLPEFMRIAQSCDLTGVELFVLIYLKHQGEPFGDKQWAFLRQRFTELLKIQLGYSDGDVDQLLNRMEQKQLVLRSRLTLEQKEKVFQTATGRKGIVVLLPIGYEKIEQIKGEIGTLFTSAIQDVPALLRRPFLSVSLPLIGKLAETILASQLRRHRSDSSTSRSRPLE